MGKMRSMTEDLTATVFSNGSRVNLKGGGQLVVKVGKGEQMNGMVPGLGSVSGILLYF